MATKLNLVTNFGREMLVFDDETRSRHHFSVRTALFWRRDSISSPFFGENRYFLATSPILVTILRWKSLNFGDEPRSRHRFWVRNACF
ncbi:hypothetical protein [Caldifermentibacillus hisashii]|uniref:hypothetical protein n=1 Tax=Caldifermentibacillus hisashii TaxID=996558 RepID=UPI002DFD828B|nr:hypothetical protein [Caldifermentibacillus hisashii]